MGRTLTAIIKSVEDKSQHKASIEKMVHKSSRIYLDANFTSDFMLYNKQWDGAILRPSSQYQYRIMHALMNPNAGLIDSVANLVTSGPFVLSTKYRPLVLTAMTDAELIAHSVSTHHIDKDVSPKGVTRYKHRQKGTISKKGIIHSLERSIDRLNTMDILLLQTDSNFPQRLSNKSDLYFLSVQGRVTDRLINNYVLDLALQGRRVLVVCKTQELPRGATHLKITNVTTPKLPPITILTNY